GNILRSRHAGGAAFCAFLPHAFIVHEEKSLVLEDRSAERAAELIIAKRILRLALFVEEISCVESVVTEKIKAGAVKAVGAALGNDVDHAASTAAVFGFGIREHAQLGNRFEREDRRRRTEYARLIDCRVVAVAVVHVCAVEQEVIGAPPGAVHGKYTERTWRIGNLVRRARDS